MIKKTIFLILICLPFFLMANATATTLTGAQGVVTSAGNFMSDFWDFFDNDVPNFFKRALAYIIEKVVLFKITAQIEAMKLAWSISKSVIESFQVGSKIASAASGLPQDVKAALVDLRLFDGLNIIVQAFIARYVMRFL
ncbi:DUF2523 domain-containing protein [Pseudoalteromonas sp. SCSIO 43210]|uniref:DUF2523 family protein n=1 Tax=Pseudoalteromonas sp. Bsw20308 TaxID=283699 RepID=UPI0002AA78A1|nr:DUF2523 family protein [Pseudoalteromonas sp. Bsw20308]ALQ10374.1 hypothetical protein D172_020110 [Pseudoalteromonas sp. Bsw20308]